MERAYRSNPDYQAAIKTIAKQRSVLSTIRWQDEQYRAAMTMKNREVSNRPQERQRRSQLATSLWSTPEYRAKQRRSRFGAPNINDALHGVTL
jgi:hypothetical protein